MLISNMLNLSNRIQAEFLFLIHTEISPIKNLGLFSLINIVCTNIRLHFRVIDIDQVKSLDWISSELFSVVIHVGIMPPKLN